MHRISPQTLRTTSDYCFFETVRLSGCRTSVNTLGDAHYRRRLFGTNVYVVLPADGFQKRQTFEIFRLALRPVENAAPTQPLLFRLSGGRPIEDCGPALSCGATVFVNSRIGHLIYTAALCPVRAAPRAGCCRRTFCPRPADRSNAAAPAPARNAPSCL